MARGLTLPSISNYIHHKAVTDLLGVQIDYSGGFNLTDRKNRSGCTMHAVM